MTVTCSALVLAGFQILFELSRNLVTLRRVISRLFARRSSAQRLPDIKGRGLEECVERSEDRGQEKGHEGHPGRLIRSAACRWAARLVLAGLDVGDKGVVGEPGGFLVQAVAGLGRGQVDAKRGAVAGGGGGVDLLL